MTNSLTRPNTRPAFSVSSTIIEGPTAVATNKWYHLAGVADSSGSVKLYLNGEQDGSGNSKLTHADIDLRIGARHPNAGGAGIVDPFPGILDEVAIFCDFQGCSDQGRHPNHHEGRPREGTQLICCIPSGKTHNHLGRHQNSIRISQTKAGTPYLNGVEQGTTAHNGAFGVNDAPVLVL